MASKGVFHIISTALAAAIMFSVSAPVQAQSWPSKPIRVLVGFGAGGGTDIATRIIAEPLGALIGQSVIVENKPGAGGTIASDQIAKADKDGHLAGVLSAGHTVSAAMFKSLPYDSLKDFAPVGLIANSAFVVVARKDFPAKDIKGLVALAKASPGKLNFGSVGVGSTQHFSGELLHQKTGMKVVHVPYRNTPGVVTALRAKEIDYAVELLHAVIGQVQAGELKLLAVGTPQRWPAIPNVPTVAESGVPGYSVVGWYGMVYPAGTPKDVVDKTNKALQTVLARKDIQEKLLKVGAVAHSSTSEEFGKHLASEVATWKAVREAANIPQK
jgi:tripartite-type tricarboxylate transporter receptor subunit TctC